jgi:ubiquinone/menaquinone biosynthesis C-methylase UbiE
MLLLNSQGLLVDFNAACRELLGLDVAGCKGQHFTYLERRIYSRIEGSLFPAGGAARVYLADAGSEARNQRDLMLATQNLRTAVDTCTYRSDRFGPVRLRVSELPRIETESGACAGSTVSLEVVDMKDRAAFQEVLDHRLAHEIMWEVYAASYDRVLPELPFYQEVLERHCHALRPDPICNVLDLGAGTGSVAVRLLRLGKLVTAVDIGRAMLQRLHAKVDQEQAERLTVIEDTAESLPHLRDESFEGVNILLALFDMEDPFSALGEAQRLLKPGGTLIITEPRECFNVGQLMAAAEESLAATGLLERLAADWKRIQSVSPLVRDAVLHTQNRTRLHAEAIMERLTRDGFVGLRFQESHLGNCATIVGTKRLS